VCVCGCLRVCVCVCVCVCACVYVLSLDNSHNITQTVLYLLLKEKYERSYTSFTTKFHPHKPTKTPAAQAPMA